MADHVPLSVKGKLLFWSMQILCKQKLIPGDCAELLISLRHCN